MVVIAVQFRMCTQNAGRITIPVSISIRRTYFAIIPGISIYTSTLVRARNAFCTRAAVQARAGITFVYIHLTAISFITRITFTVIVLIVYYHTSSIRSTIYPYTWGHHVT
jgi:hypothetical protein